jgi:tRNA-Thr(GGU) m(6)t(6)A37 methyltransferase TsaA
MGDDRGVQPGEERIVLPPANDAQLRFIGRIRTPWATRADCPKNSRDAMALGDDARCVIELDPLYAPGLKDLESFSHVWAIYWMDGARRDLVVQAPRHLDGSRGVFALRSPARPNPLAMAAARLVAIDGTHLTVIGVDCLDGTPLIDLKPYFASTDSIPEAVRP